MTQTLNATLETKCERPAIEVSGLSKIYFPRHSLWDWLKTGAKQSGTLPRAAEPGAVKALEDISFTVAKGEAFGIIGRNGAGKSTLLQILAGTLRPSAGDCRIHGRVTALLELGSGFNPEFTGRENIYLSGSILGITRPEMDRKIEEIEAFADIGEFVHSPVKTYSTGMLMRVAFAVAVAVDPEILIIDEALSVGDILFQQKCSLRLREMLNGGTTLLLVTHDTASVLNLCSRAIWLNKGRNAFLGSSAECVRAYLTAMSAAAGNQVLLSSVSSGQETRLLPDGPSLDLAKRQRMGDGQIYIEAAWLQNGAGAATSVFRVGDNCRLSILIKARKEMRLASAGCELRDRLGQVIFATGLRVVKKLVECLREGETRLAVIEFRLDISPGQYTVDIGTGAGELDDTSFQRIPAATVIEVSANPEDEVVHGIVRLPSKVDVFLPA